MTSPATSIYKNSRRMSPRRNAAGGRHMSSVMPSTWRPSTVPADQVVKGSCYYLPHPQKVWAAVIVLERPAHKRCRVRVLVDGSEMDLDLRECALTPMHYEGKDTDINNLALCGGNSARDDVLNEPAILAVLESRAKMESRHCYMYVGSILLCMNPLKDLPDPSLLEIASNHLQLAHSLPPHPYTLAEEEYMKLKSPKKSFGKKKDYKNQCIVVTGISGSGISRTTSKIVEYLCWRGTEGKGAHLAPSNASYFSTQKSIRMLPDSREDFAPPSSSRANAASRIPEKSKLAKAFANIDTIFHVFLGAATPLNRTSSRYGRLFQLTFGKVSGGVHSGRAGEAQHSVNGATVEAFFLEISRLTSVKEGHRNFNIFYALLSGANKELRRAIAALPIDRFNYLTQIEDIQGIDEVDDAANFAAVVSAMANIGITDSQRQSVFKIMSACLHLGNIDFKIHNENTRASISKSAKDVPNTHFNSSENTTLQRGSTTKLQEKGDLDEKPSSKKGFFIPFGLTLGKKNSSTNVKEDIFIPDLVKVVHRGPLDVTALLLGVNSTDLENLLLQKQNGGIEGAISMRDTLAKAIYFRTVSWLIEKCNECLKQTIVSDNPPYQLYSSSPQNITIMEFPGFEKPRKNAAGLPELLRNIALERLNQTINRVLIVSPQELMIAEGIKGIRGLKTDSSMGHSSADALKLLEGSPYGITTMLEEWNSKEEIYVGDPGNAFTAALYKAHQSDLLYLPECDDDSTMPSKFAVRHYAGIVEYSAEGLIEANRDSIWRGYINQSVADLLNTSNQGAILQKDNAGEKYIIQGGEFLTDNAGASASCRVVMTDLLTHITSDSTTFALCIAPNRNLSFGVFDHRCVVEQIRSLNLVALCQTMRMGANTYVLYSDLDSLYRPRLPGWARNIKALGSGKQLAQSVLWALDISESDVTWGTHSLFIRHGIAPLLHLLRLTSAKKEQRTAIVRSITHWSIRQTFRAGLALGRSQQVLLDILDNVRRRKKAYNTLKRIKVVGLWRSAVVGRDLSARRRLMRRRWRVAIIAVIAARMFQQEVALVAGAKNIHKKAQDSARQEEEREQELLKELEGYDKFANEEESVAADSGALRSQLSLGHLEKSKSGLISTLNRESAQGSTKDLITDVTEVKEEMAKKKNVRELRATAAATTLTACLFRWQRVHIFAAFDKWLEGTLSKEEELRRPLSRILDPDRFGLTMTASDEEEEEGCEECEGSRRVTVWCQQCPSSYCSLCSSFVHNSCRIMSLHIPRPIEDLEDNDYAKKGGSHWRGIGGSSNKQCAIRTCGQVATHGVTIRFCETHYKEFRQVMAPRDKEEKESSTDNLYNQIALLKKQLASTGQVALEFVSLETAKLRMHEAVIKLMAGDESAEKDIDKWDKCIRLHPDYEKEQKELAIKWEADNKEVNNAALRIMRGFVPPDIGVSGVNKMVSEGLPTLVAQRIWKFKVLQWVRWHPDDIKKVHIADLQTNYTNQGLDVMEMRAVWCVIPEEFDLDGDNKKGQWRLFFCQKLQELTGKEEKGNLSRNEKRHPAYKGTDGMQIYDPDAPLAKKSLAKSSAFDATEQPTNLIALASSSSEVVIKPKITGSLEALTEPGKMPASLYGVLLDDRLLLYKTEREFRADEQDGGTLGAGSSTLEYIIDKDTSVKSVQPPKESRGSARYAVKIDCKATKKNLTILLPSEASAQDWIKFLSKVATRDEPKKPVSAPSQKQSQSSNSSNPPRPPPPGFLDSIKGKNKEDSDTQRPPNPMAPKPGGQPDFMEELRRKKAEKDAKNSGGNKPPNPMAPKPGGQPDFMEELRRKKAEKDAKMLGADKPPNPMAPKPGGQADFLEEIKRKKAEKEAKLANAKGDAKPDGQPNSLEEIKRKKAEKEAAASSAPNPRGGAKPGGQASFLEEIKRKQMEKEAQSANGNTLPTRPKPSPFGDNPAGPSFLEAIRQKAIEKERLEASREASHNTEEVSSTSSTGDPVSAIRARNATSTTGRPRSPANGRNGNDSIPPDNDLLAAIKARRTSAGGD